jgi:hypothetical protein
MSRYVTIAHKQGSPVELTWEEFEKINSTGLTPEIFVKVRAELLFKSIASGVIGKDT